MDSRKISDLQPVAGRKCLELFGLWFNSGLDPIITCTVRSLEESLRLYCQGRTKPGKIVTMCKPGQSFHNYGVAWDAYPRIEGSILWAYDDTILHQQHWDKMGQIAETVGVEWGRHFHSIKDTPHWQFTQGHDLAYFQGGGKL